MLTPTQFGAIQSPPITKQAVHAAINAKPCRIKPRPKCKMCAGRVVGYEIKEDAVLELPRKPGRKARRNER